MIFKIKRNALHIDVSVSIRGVEQIEPKCSSDIRGVTELPASLQTVTESASPLTSCGTFVKDILKTNNGREHNQAPVPKTNPHLQPHRTLTLPTNTKTDVKPRYLPRMGVCPKATVRHF